MDAPIAAAKKELVAFLPILAEYNDLNSRQVAASSDLAQSQAEWRHALALKAAATSDNTVYLGPTTPADKQATLVATLPVIIGVGLFLAVLLILLIEVTTRLRARHKAAVSLRPPRSTRSQGVAEHDEPAMGPDTHTVNGHEPFDADASPVTGSAMPSSIDDSDILGDAEQEAEPEAARSRV